MRKGLLLLIASLITCSVAAQQNLPDSIRQKFAGISQDSTYVNKLNDTAFEYLKTNPGIARAVASYSLEIATRIKYERGYARALTVTGNTYWYEGVYEFAQNYYLLAARQYQALHDSTGLGETYNNIGEVYKRLNDHENALEYLKKSLDLIRKDSAKRALIFYNLGELYIRLNRMEDAKAYTQKSYDISRAIGNDRILAFSYWSLAAIEQKEKNYNAALTYFLEAERIWKQTGELRSLIQTYQDIAYVYLEKNDFPLAEKYLKRAIALAGQIKVPDLQVTNYLRYAKLDSLRGNYARALIHLSRHNTLKDSVYNILKAEQIARLQTIYETERRDHENRQLRIEKELKDSELDSQRVTTAAISAGLLLAGILAWFLYRQRKEIFFQKEAIEIQAAALLKLNAELQELNKNLEARINERTSQLTVQNQRLAEYTFINAHKLRAPVASILGLINLMNQPDPSDKEIILTHLKTCGEALDKIIHEVSRNLEEAIVKEHHH